MTPKFVWDPDDQELLLGKAPLLNLSQKLRWEVSTYFIPTSAYTGCTLCGLLGMSTALH